MSVRQRYFPVVHYKPYFQDKMLQSVETRTFMGLEKSDQHPYDRQMKMIKTILAVAKPESKHVSRENNRASQNMNHGNKNINISDNKTSAYPETLNGIENSTLKLKILKISDHMQSSKQNICF